MAATTNWDTAYNEVLRWALQNRGLAHTLTLSNHHLGPRHFELRIWVRDAAGLILVASRGRRAARYLDCSIENFICVNLSGALNIPPGRCRTLGEPDAGGPTYPLWDAEKEPGQTELPAQS